MRRVVAAVLLGSLAVSGCATAPAAPPRLPGGHLDLKTVPNSDAFLRWFRDLQTSCPLPIITARAHARGSVDDRRIDASFWVGVELVPTFRPGVGAGSFRVLMESTETGASGFVLLASYSSGSDARDEATLLLNGRRVVRSGSRELLEFVLGVPLSGLELRSVLTGCPMTGETRMEPFDAATLKVGTSRGNSAIDLFMRRNLPSPTWELFAMTGTVPGWPLRWRADPGHRSRGVLESVRLMNVGGNERTDKRFDLTISFDRIQTPPVGADLLSLSIPNAAEVVALDTLRSHMSTPLLQ